MPLTAVRSAWASSAGERGEARDRQRAVVDRGGDRPQRPDLRGGQAGRAQSRVGGGGEGARRHAGKPRREPRPDRRGARRRELLRDDDAGQALEAGLALAQRRLRARRNDAAHDGIAPGERPRALSRTDCEARIVVTVTGRAFVG